MITHERLLEIINYDPLTGIFTRKVKTSNFCKMNEPVGSFTNGYLEASLDGKLYKLHRIAWFYVHGVWPVRDIDHRDRIRHHNWIDNLREANDCENEHNKIKYSNNKSGYKGVSWDKLCNKWRAQIGVNGKRMYIGCADTPEKAYEMYCEAAKRLHKEYHNLG